MLMRIRTSYIALFSLLPTVAGAAGDISAVLNEATPAKIERIAADGNGPGDKTSQLSMDGCVLTQTVITPMDGSDIPHREISAIDLRIAREITDVSFNESRQADVVRVSLQKGKTSEISDAFSGVKETFASEVSRLEQERGISFVDFDARKALNEEVLDAIIPRINQGEFGTLPAEAYVAASGRIQPPLPHLQVFIKAGQGQGVAEALEAHRKTCAG